MICPRLLLPVLIVVAFVAFATDGRTADTHASNGTALSAEQEQETLAFIKEHHPQLNSLIRRLKTRDPAEYDQALRDVYKTCERLQRLQPRDPQRYEVDLNLWKVDSRIRLLAARMAGDDRPTLQNQLRDLLNERTDLRLQRLTLERERLTARIERIDSQVSQLSAERDAAIEKELERLQKSVRSRTSRISKKSTGKKTTADEKPGKSDKTPTPSRDKQRPAEKASGSKPPRT